MVSTLVNKKIVTEDVNQISAAASSKTTINIHYGIDAIGAAGVEILDGAMPSPWISSFNPTSRCLFVEFDEAVKGKDVSDRWAAKLSMKKLGLI